MIRRCLVLLLLALTRAALAAPDATTWPAIEAAAQNQTVYFNAWAGDPAINAYIDWAAKQVQARYGIRLVHVKLADTASAVSRILAERQAGRRTGGSVDLMWINGENFANLKNADLLLGKWTQLLPNAAAIDVSNPSVATDFTLPTAGFELPWGGAQFTFFYESRAVPAPAPTDPATLLQWIQAHSGRFTYPQPPDFLGTSFLKQMLLLLVADPERLQHPVAADFDQATQPLWVWLDAAKPHLWRKGRIYPRSGPEQRRLLGDGELDWALAFNPAEADRAIQAGDLPDTVRALQMRAGVLANSHFLAIPANASAAQAAMVVANFLLSPEAQARKADESVWGDPTVLALERLTPSNQLRFTRLKTGPARPPRSGPLLSEPHPSWTLALQRAWQQRYGSQ